MIREKKQLYSTVSALVLPDSASVFAGIRRVHQQRIGTTAFMRWPDGATCLPVNMYLLDHAALWTGESALTYASQLSPIVRYCATAEKGFGQLTDGDVARLVDLLRAPVNGRRVRNNNTIRSILQRTLHFLEWFQRNLYRGETPLIGEATECAAITAVRAKSKRNNERYWHHRSAPKPVSSHRKPPIPYTVVEDIELAIEEVAAKEAACEPAARRFSSDPKFQMELNGYLYERREFMIWMLKRTGLRPAELVGMPLEANRASILLAHPCMLLPTKKRRTEEVLMREFPVSEKDVRNVLRYLKARDRWEKSCVRRHGERDRVDAMFLTAAAKSLGMPVQISGLEKDFEKLCAAAGYVDFQVCFSMFRHRFITDEVRAHMEAWKQNEGAIIIDQDYRAILERVRVKTGHASVESLWHYIDIARETEGLWTPVDQALERERNYRDIVGEVDRIRRGLAAPAEDALRLKEAIENAMDALGDLVAAQRPSSLGKNVQLRLRKRVRD